ncbi:MAG: hypothetical protein M1839_003313 [Geoglossum umbratile]|nr:MAG: hypothetical protein M1839_003313 [Geoglossum umbratile]
MGKYYSLDRNADFALCQNRTNGTLTYPQCQILCGSGVDLWPFDEITGRFTLWLFPAVVLVAHFHYAPISFLNTCAITLHHLSSPIDSMHSLIIRLELQRRCLHLAEKVLQKNRENQENRNNPFQGDLHQDSRHLAAIWCAYDELGFSVTQGDIKEPRDNREWLLAKEAAYRLTTNRTESQRPTWVAVIGYLGALIGAFVRTKTTRDNNQTSHTIALVSLLSYFVALVLISSTIGVFRSVPDTLDVLQQLHRDVVKHRGVPEEPLFPKLQRYSQAQVAPWDPARLSPGSKPLRKNTNIEDQNTSPSVQDTENLRNWLTVAPWTGMNSSWRPYKTMHITVKARNRNPWLLFLCSFAFVLIGSYFPAIILSLYSGSVGFGCRCLAWTFIAIAWVLSLVIDNTMKTFIPSAKRLWSCTVAKDFIFSTFIVGTILSIQIGFLNTCYCRANVITSGINGTLTLKGFSEDEWNRNWVVWPTATVSGFFVMLAFGYLVHILDIDRRGKWWRFKFANGILCKGERERDDDLLGIGELRRKCQGDAPSEATTSHARRTFCTAQSASSRLPYHKPTMSVDETPLSDTEGIEMAETPNR